MSGVEYRGCGAKLPGTGGLRLAYSLLVALARIADQQLGESGWGQRLFAGRPRCPKTNGDWPFPGCAGWHGSQSTA